jgi:hypothetical protein
METFSARFVRSTIATSARMPMDVRCGGRPHRQQLSRMFRSGGCIDRQPEEIALRRSGGIHRLHFGPAKTVVTLMALVDCLAGSEGAAFVTKV